MGLEIPAVSDNEAARVIADGEPLHVDSTSHGSTEAGTDYVVEAACSAVNKAAAVAYQITTDGAVVSTGTIACDGNTYRNTGLIGTGGEAQLTFDDVPGDVTRAFARLVSDD